MDYKKPILSTRDKQGKSFDYFKEELYLYNLFKYLIKFFIKAFASIKLIKNILIVFHSYFCLFNYDLMHYK